MNFLHPKLIFRDILLLLARVGLGAIFMAHGLQKFVTNGMDGTAEGFAAMGVPLPTVSAWFAALVETIGGAALILGLLTPVFGVLLATVMVGAMVFVHLPNGIWVADNGYELVLALAAGACALVGVGAGRLSIDALLAPRAAAAQSKGSVSAARERVSA